MAFISANRIFAMRNFNTWFPRCRWLWNCSGSFLCTAAALQVLTHMHCSRALALLRRSAVMFWLSTSQGIWKQLNLQISAAHGTICTVWTIHVQEDSHLFHVKSYGYFLPMSSCSQD
jgi:hypothetical protein